MSCGFVDVLNAASDHLGNIQPVGIFPHFLSAFAEFIAQAIRGIAGQIADGVHAQCVQFFGRRTADAQQIGGREVPYLLPKVLRCDDRHGIRLFHITAQLGKYLVERHTDRHRYAQLSLDALPYLVRDLLARAVKFAAARHIQPAFVQSHRLDHVGIVVVDLPCRTGDLDVFLIMRRHDDQPRAFLLSLPDGLSGDNAKALGDVILC